MLEEDGRAGQELSQARGPALPPAPWRVGPGRRRVLPQRGTSLLPASATASSSPGPGLLLLSGGCGVSGILGLSPGTALPTTHPQLARPGGLFPEMEQIFMETVNLATEYGLNG